MTECPAAPQLTVRSTCCPEHGSECGGTDGVLWGPEERAAVLPEPELPESPLENLGLLPMPLSLSFLVCGSAGSEEFKPKESKVL